MIFKRNVRPTNVTARRHSEGCGHISLVASVTMAAFATLLDVVNHDNDFDRLNLTDREKRDLVEYLKSP